MIARCWVGACDWVEAGPSPVELTAAAEVHRLQAHEWVAPGKCHRLELDLEEEGWVEVRVAAELARLAEEAKHPANMENVRLPRHNIMGS